MQNTRLLSFILLVAISPSVLLAQQSSSTAPRPTQLAQAAQPTPTPEVHKRRSIPEVEDAMAKGEDLLFKKHDPRASLDEFRRAAKLDPWYGDAYMLLGLAQMQLRQWNDAQWAFEEAAKVEPGNAKAYLGAGSALNEEKNYPEAQKALQHSLEIRPDSAEAHYELARSLWGMGKWQLAEPHVRRPLNLTKTMPGLTR